VVGDRCRPFDAARAAVPEAPAPGRLFEGGQGLRLLHAFASELGYESEGGENRLTMVFRPASSAAGQV
jgi:anti-sigma regulatory factor (Ser/Thr protein kinase)